MQAQGGGVGVTCGALDAPARGKATGALIRACNSPGAQSKAKSRVVPVLGFVSCMCVPHAFGDVKASEEFFVVRKVAL